MEVKSKNTHRIWMRKSLSVGIYFIFDKSSVKNLTAAKNRFSFYSPAGPLSHGTKNQTHWEDWIEVHRYVYIQIQDKHLPTRNRGKSKKKMMKITK